ncbi:putative methyltransferase PMT14 [Hibiscus syriacus]|uniref:Methyltransferase PMT14 n=1 Tax=Hibiscus syriacus TaxID=106335 RepID=A0A6A3C542_HIBSY|nr:putative methyltransferase PMT14 [Hibiscus syriacus]
MFPINQGIVKITGVVSNTAWSGAVYNLVLCTLASHYDCWSLECTKEMNATHSPSCNHYFLDCSTVRKPARNAWLKKTNVIINRDAINDDNKDFEFGMFADAFTNNVAYSAFTDKFFYCLCKTGGVENPTKGYGRVDETPAISAGFARPCPPDMFLVREGDPVREMLFIIRGEVESSTTNGGRIGFYNSITLGPGDFCGEELLTWALIPNSDSFLNLPLSTRTVKSITEILFPPMEVSWGACFIEAAWRRYKRRKLAIELAKQENLFDDGGEGVLGCAEEQEDGGGSSDTSHQTQHLGVTLLTSKFAKNTRRGAKRVMARISHDDSMLKMPKMFKPVEPDFSALWLPLRLIMATKENPGVLRRSGFDKIASAITRKPDCTPHVGDDVKVADDLDVLTKEERHCPPEEKKLHCLIPAPKGYATPFLWPQSRDFVHYANAPYKNLTVEKGLQNWIQYDVDVFSFPGGGPQFPQGVDTYINQLASVIPMENGTVRTALDTGCGVASLGAYLFKKNVITMSFAPRDSHEAQVQFALDRGAPAVIGVMGTIKMPFPSRAFDMAHCSRCSIPWSGMYMMEIDRVLRPGGYWVLSGPPINWRNNYQSLKRPEKGLKKEQRKIEQTALLLCWEKIREIQEIAVWRKRKNYNLCHKNDPKPTYCVGDPDDVWYKKMEACVTPYPETTESDDVAGGDWKPFPERLNAVPFRISSQSVPGVSVEAYQDDKLLWERRVEAYKNVNNIIDSGRYRNIIDMNAGLGSFAAALDSPKLWVMNVMPTIAEKDTLGVIYEQGLIGIYHDW